MMIENRERRGESEESQIQRTAKKEEEKKWNQKAPR